MVVVVAAAAAPALAVVVVVAWPCRGRVVGGVFGACAAVRSSSAFWTFLLTASCWSCDRWFRSDCTLSVCLLPLPSSSTVGSINPVPFRALVACGLGDARRGDRPLGPALELDAQVQPAPQHDRDDPEHDDRRRDAEPDLALADEVEARLAPVEPGDRAVTPPGLGQEGAGGVIEADELLLVEAAGVDALLELARRPPRGRRRGSCRRRGRCDRCRVVAHEPPPAPAPAADGHALPGAGLCVCGPAPRPVAMLKAPEPCSRWLWPSRITSGRV